MAATILDAAFFFFPQQTIGIEYVSPANPLLAGFWSAVAVAVALALHAGWNSLAFRIEAATEDHDVDILVSETTQSLAGAGGATLVPVGEIALRGRQSRLRAFRLEDK